MAAGKKGKQTYLEYGEYHVFVEQKKMKHIYLRIMENGMLHVTAPLYVKKEDILRFLQEKESWIQEHAAKRQEKSSLEAKCRYQTGEQVFLFGQSYQLVVKEYGARSKVTLLTDSIEMQVPDGATEEMRKKVLDFFYRKQLETAIREAFLKWEPVVGKQHSTVTIRDMKTRWGSCNVRTAQISLNLQLAKKPLYCLDYVVVHELCHLWVPNHGVEFKAFMDRFYPNWREVKKILNGEENVFS